MKCSSGTFTAVNRFGSRLAYVVRFHSFFISGYMEINLNNCIIQTLMKGQNVIFLTRFPTVPVLNDEYYSGC